MEMTQDLPGAGAAAPVNWMLKAIMLTCGVVVNIQAKAASIWKLLTDAEDFPRWNSTISGIQGQIREGERLQLRVPGTDRTFTPKVSEIAAGQRMTWTGGFAPLFKGVRTFELRPLNDGSTDFDHDHGHRAA